MTDTLEIGKANYSGNRGEKLTFYRLGMKDNQRELVLRIAPPIKDLAASGNFGVYLKQHFGYSVAGKGDKRIPQTFNCIERKDKSKNIVQECPECTEIALRKADIEAKEASLKANKTPEEVIEAQLRPAKAWLKDHNCDRKWNMLAKNESNQWGFLAISHSTYENLLAEIKRLQSLGIEDPLGAERGVWFKFTRTGTKFNDIKDSVNAVMTANGESLTVKRDTLVAADYAALKSLPNLTGLGRKLTYDQIRSLVMSGGDENVVKAVFQSATPVRGETSPVPVAQPTTMAPTAPSAAAVAQVMATPIAPAVQPAATPVVPADIAAQFAAMQAELAKLRGQVATPVAAAPATVQTPTVSPSLQKSLDMDVEDFVRDYGNN